MKVPHLQGPTWMGLVMCSHFGRFCTFKPHHHKWFQLLSSPFPQSPSVPCLSATLGLGSWVVWVRLGHFSKKSGVTSSPWSHGFRTSGSCESYEPGNGSTCDMGRNNVGNTRSQEFAGENSSSYHRCEMSKEDSVLIKTWSEQRSPLVGIHSGMQ